MSELNLELIMKYGKKQVFIQDLNLLENFSEAITLETLRKEIKKR